MIYLDENKFLREIRKAYGNNLQDRILNFAISTLKFLIKLPRIRETDVIRFQLSKSVTAIGANYEEAQSSGDREFLYKLRIALKEANETKYWFKILDQLNMAERKTLSELIQESAEISLILGSIVSKLDKKFR
jgi:four helix bundle protein